MIFLKGGSILKNILLTQKIVTDIRKKSKPANVVIKLHIAKAYNRVSWFLLMKVLRRISFSNILLTFYGGCFLTIVLNSG